MTMMINWILKVIIIVTPLASHWSSAGPSRSGLCPDWMIFSRVPSDHARGIPTLQPRSVTIEMSILLKVSLKIGVTPMKRPLSVTLREIENCRVQSFI